MLLVVPCMVTDVYIYIYINIYTYVYIKMEPIFHSGWMEYRRAEDFPVAFKLKLYVIGLKSGGSCRCGMVPFRAGLPFCFVGIFCA